MSDLPEIISATVLGPDDVLVLTLPAYATDWQREHLRESIDDHGLSGRVLFVAGTTGMAVLRATKAEGSTVGQCGDRAELVLQTLSSAPVLVNTCHLAHGHMGMHSDGIATWTNEPAICGETAFLDMGTAHLSRCALAPGHDGPHRGDLGRSWTNEARPCQHPNPVEISHYGDLADGVRKYACTAVGCGKQWTEPR